MDALSALSVPNIVFALIGASGAAIVLLVLMRRGWDVNLSASARSIEELTPAPDSFKERLETKLREADFPITADEFIRASLLWGLASAAGVQAALGYWGLSLSALVIAPLLYWQYMEARRDQRGEDFLTDLSLSIDDLREAFSINPSTKTAIEALAKNASPMMRPHFERMAKRLDSGSSETQVLRLAAAEIGNAYFDELVETLIENFEKGGSITPVLERMSKAVRGQLSLLRTARAEQTNMRTQSRIVAAAPFVFLTIIKLSAPSYADPFYNSLAGQIALSIIVAMVFGGYWWMNKLAGSGLTLRRFKHGASVVESATPAWRPAPAQPGSANPAGIAHG